MDQKGQTDYLTLILAVGIIAAILAGGVWFAGFFMDYEEQLEGIGDSTGEINIDEESLENTSENLDTLLEKSTKGLRNASEGFAQVVGAFTNLVIILVAVGSFLLLISYLRK